MQPPTLALSVNVRMGQKLLDQNMAINWCPHLVCLVLYERHFTSHCATISEDFETQIHDDHGILKVRIANDYSQVHSFFY